MCKRLLLTALLALAAPTVAGEPARAAPQPPAGPVAAADDASNELEPALPLTGPFGNQGGLAWLAPAPADWPSDGADGQRSELVLLEDGVPLGPAHAAHDAVRSAGAGAYSHWGANIWFSTSDGSDPNSNGRAYAVSRPRRSPGRDGWRLLPPRDPFRELPPRSRAWGAGGAAGVGAEVTRRDDAPTTIYWYVIDALRTDVARERLPDGTPLMPALEAFRREAIDFSSAYAPSSFTKTSAASMFTGLWPQRHGVMHGYVDVWPGGGALFFDLDRRSYTLAEALADHGYDTWTHAFTIHVQPGCGLLEGFAHLDLASDRAAPVPDDVDGPLFAYEHVLGVHGPYDPSATARARLGLAPPTHVDPAGLDWFYAPLDEAALAELRDAYRAECIDADADLAGRLQWLRDSGRWDDAVVIVTADHGEEFFEHGATQHSVQLYEEVLHVPLLIRFPAGHRWAARHGQRIDQRVRLIDLYPTLLELVAGADEPLPYALDGRSLGPILEGTERGPYERDVLARVSFTTEVEGQGQRALLVQDAVAVDRLKGHLGWRIRSAQDREDWDFRQGQWVGELYDLRADPAEQHDLATHQPDWLERLGERLVAAHAPLHLPGERAAAPDADGGRVDPGLTEALRALGYLGGGDGTGDPGGRPAGGAGGGRGATDDEPAAGRGATGDGRR